jgi:hypothetical protein
MLNSEHHSARDLSDISAKGALVAIALALIVIAMLVGASVLRGGNFSSSVPNKDEYQAVFLANGQAYFGHLSGIGSSYVSLNDVYTVDQAQASPAPGATPGPQLQLIRRSDNNLLKPESPMQISSDQIISWENLKDDSEVVKAIKQKQDQSK